MPANRIRELFKKKLKRSYLRARVFRTALLGSIMPGVVTLLIGVGIYTSVQIANEINASFRLAAAVSEEIEQRIPETETMMREVVKLCRSAAAGNPADFQSLTETESYQNLRELLDSSRRTAGARGIYVAYYDPESIALIYLCDSDAYTQYSAGYRELAEKKEIEKFSHWDGKSVLYYFSAAEKYTWLCTSGVPVYGEDGSPVYYVLSDVTMEGIIGKIRNFVLLYIVAAALMMIVTGYFVSRNMEHTLADPINQITDAARKYAEERKVGETGTDHFSQLDIKSGDEVENLSKVMAEMEQSLKTYEENLTRITAEKERIDTELTLAAKIQEGMLKRRAASFAGNSLFTIEADMKPAREVGGDFFCHGLLDEDHLMLAIADVSGKGIPAALLMMSAMILIESAASSGKSPAGILEVINRKIAEYNPQEMFVTAWIGILDLCTGVLTAANAGHEYPVLKKPGKQFERIKDVHGLVCGADLDYAYKEYTLKMDPGTILFLHTDGLTDATDENGEMFGGVRMVEALRGCGSTEPKEILDAVKAEVGKFVNGTEQFDDLTMLCVRYNGKVNYPQLTVDAAEEAKPKVIEFVNEELQKRGCPAERLKTIDLAVDELFTNIFSYAFDGETGKAEITAGIDENGVAEIVLKDRGKPFNPLRQKEPDIHLPAKERNEGGLGIFIAKKVMDDFAYEYKEGYNITRIRKKVI